jgi:Fe-S-cluster containining protein
MSVTCGGQCCAVFFQPRDRHLEPESGKRDFDFITDMLVPLELGVANARARRFGMRLADWIDAEGWERLEGRLYTCRHFDGRLCTAYNDRPAMCSEYPYDKGCHTCNFTASEDIRTKWWVNRRRWVFGDWWRARQGAA